MQNHYEITWKKAFLDPKHKTFMKKFDFGPLRTFKSLLHTTELVFPKKESHPFLLTISLLFMKSCDFWVNWRKVLVANQRKHFFQKTCLPDFIKQIHHVSIKLYKFSLEFDPKSSFAHVRTYFWFHKLRNTQEKYMELDSINQETHKGTYMEHI